MSAAPGTEMAASARGPPIEATADPAKSAGERGRLAVGSMLVSTGGPVTWIALPSRALVALLDRAIVRLLPAVPKPVVRRLSSRYIAGPSLEDAIRVVARLNAKGKLATVDVLGEEIASADEARAIAGRYHDVLA